jgi:hypothetical protein
MPRLNVRLAQYPGQLTQPGRYEIEAVKPPQETRYGQTLILIVTNTEGQQASLFVPFATETSEQTNLGRLIKAFGAETDHWIGKKLDVSIDETGRRTVEPVLK